MLRRLFDEQRPLIIAGIVSAAASVLMLLLIAFDPTPVLGINRWIKPLKFFVSIWIYVWTIALFLSFLIGRVRESARIAWASVAVFAIEMAVIVVQAFRGTKSHFNFATPLDGALYAIMGLAIVFNTFLVGYLLFLYFRSDTALSPTLLWGIRLGIVILLLGSIQGGYMSSQIGHTVGAVDGGSGLPFVNWSTQAGDLRVAHFFGLHALQAVPLFAYFAERIKLPGSLVLTWVFALGYLAFFSFLFMQAMKGQPFLSQLF